MIPVETALSYRSEDLNLRKFQGERGELHATDIEKVANLIERDIEAIYA